MNTYFLNIVSNNIGGYFSSEQIDLLRIIQCNNIDELFNFIKECDQIKHLFNKEELIKLNNLDIETAKKYVFKTYQNTMILHNSDKNIAIENKLINIGINKEDISQVKELIIKRDMPTLRQYIETNYQNKSDEIIMLSHHFVSQERDQIKSEYMYEEFTILNSTLYNFNTMLIGSGRINEVVNNFYNTESEKDKRFDFYKAKRDLDFAYTNGKQVRFHSLLTKEDNNHLFNGKSKDEILKIIKDYVTESIKFVTEYNNTHKLIINNKEVPVINSIDLFNEIISFDKNEQGEYYNIWEEKYGITIEDICEVFDYAREHKPDGVSYLYNEPFLENNERRQKVLETLNKIDNSSPGLIDTLGSQMHITMTEEENIKNCFKDLKELQEKTGKKIQITEFDLSLGYSNIISIFGQNPKINLEEVYAYKKQKINTISNIIYESGINLSGISYWSLTDSLDFNLERIRTTLLEQGLINDIKEIPTV